MQVDQKTGEIMDQNLELNKVIVKEYKRKDGSTAVEFDYSNCPTMAEQHTAHLTNLNYLIKKYKPDELAAYIAARTSYRTEILGNDFSKEPNLQDIKNQVYQMRKNFDALPDEVRNQFANHVEFFKFIDNPDNAEKMVRLGLLTKEQIKLQTQKNDEPNNELKPTEVKIKAPDSKS